jgi:predicted secreted hydrolase
MTEPTAAGPLAPAPRPARPAPLASALPTAVLLGASLLAGCGAEDVPRAAAGPATGLSGVRFLADTAASDAGFARAIEPRSFVFPADHLPHPQFRTEWWYFTGNVLAADGRHFGFELTLFRIALAVAGPARESTLAANDIWMGNLAVTDTAAARFTAAERLSRGAAGIAGATVAADAAVTIALEDWSLVFTDAEVELRAAEADFGIELDLTGLDRIVPQGDAGLDAKGPEAGNASYYFSAPRLAVTGAVHTAGTEVAVTGTAWMDREWSTSALSADLAGWDWFALQLDDGRDLMFYRLRRGDGGTSSFSGGSLTTAAGAVQRLSADAVQLTITREWTSPATGVRYPVGWTLAVPSQALELAVRPRLDAQELDLTVRYWEGAVTVDGTAAGQPVGGVGYLELAGY